MQNIMVTGVAGFIGSKVAEMLLEKGFGIVGVDNLNDYYDVRIKNWRLQNLTNYPGFIFYRTDVENYEAMKTIFQNHTIDAVINEAARAGVRSSLENPFVYYSTNVMGTLNLLELCNEHKVKKFVLASTSSLYAGQPMPFTEDLPVNAPISPYAASKKSAEVTAYCYHFYYGIDVSVLRYFSVYGPAGRPDMSVFRFIKWIMEGKRLEVFGDGSQSRDFTYIDDIAEGTIKALKPIGYEIINLGSNASWKLTDLISLIEKCTGKKAVLDYKEFHKADMRATWAEINKAEKLLEWKPKVTFEEGIRKTVDWMRKNTEFLARIKI